MFEEHPMLLTFSRGFKDIIKKTDKFKEFPGLENKFQNSRGFKEIKDTREPCRRYLPVKIHRNVFGKSEPQKRVEVVKT